MLLQLLMLLPLLLLFLLLLLLFFKYQNEIASLSSTFSFSLFEVTKLRKILEVRFLKRISPCALTNRKTTRFLGENAHPYFHKEMTTEAEREEISASRKR